MWTRIPYLVLASLLAFKTWRLLHACEVAVYQTGPQIRAELADTRTWLSQELSAVREEVKAIRRDGATEAVAWRNQLSHLTTTSVDRLDARLASLETKSLEVADRQLTAANATMDHRLGEVVGVVQAIPVDAKYATRWLWDCQNFAGCAQAQILGTLGSVRATSGVIARQAPRFVEASAKTAEASVLLTTSTAQLAANMAVWTRPRPVWQRILNAALLSAPGVAALAK